MVFIRSYLIVRKLIILVAILSLCLPACQKRQKPTKPNAQAKQFLTVYCTDTFRKSGLEASTVPDFASKNECRLELVLFRNSAELSKAIRAKENYGKFDLAIGVDNAFAISDSLADYFVALTELNKDQLTQEIIFDPQYRLIPYAYSNLGIIYNTRSIPAAPQSFGELQNARYLAQMAICDPHESGVGRATLFWSLGLFGTEGYEHLWKSLRKNIYKSYPDRNEALAALTKGECNLLLSLNTIPAHLEELDPQNQKFAVSMMKEGSYQYIESLGIHRGSQKSVLAEKFLRHFLNENTQKMIVYKLGMFPANRKTLLPMHFSAIPFSSYSVNDKLPLGVISEQLNTWLDFWDRLFGFQIS